MEQQRALLSRTELANYIMNRFFIHEISKELKQKLSFINNDKLYSNTVFRSKDWKRYCYKLDAEGVILPE